MANFVRPDTAVLTIPSGYTLTVRKRLNIGEEHDALLRMRVTDPVTGRSSVDPILPVYAWIEAYLLDWTITDELGAVVVIRPDRYRAPDLATLRDILRQLEPDLFVEVKEAIEAHRAAEARARETEKKTIRSGDDAPKPTSESPVAVIGPSTMSEASTPTTTR